jgi:hypothetical protein
MSAIGANPGLLGQTQGKKTSAGGGGKEGEQAARMRAAAVRLKPVFNMGGLF